MADDINEINKKINELRAELRKNPLTPFDIKDLEKAKALLSGLHAEVREISSDLNYVYNSFKDSVNELANQKNYLSDAKKSLNGIASIAQKVSEYRKGESELSEKQLKNIQRQAKIKFNELITIKNIGNLIGKNLDELNQAIDAEEKFNKSIERTVEIQKQVNKEIGLLGTGVGGVAKALSKIGFGDLSQPFNDAIEKTKNARKQILLNKDAIAENNNELKSLQRPYQYLSQAERDRKKELLKSNLLLKSQNGELETQTSKYKNIGNALKAQLTSANLIDFAITQIVDALITSDKGAGELAKGFNMTYDEAMGVREELTKMGNLSGDVALNTRALQETLMAVGKALGSNAMLNEADLVTFTKLREQAGFTNEELLGIEKTTLATGGNLEKNAKNILYSAKLTGLNNKVLLNEKDIMRDVAKASDAIKLSLGGSGKKLGEAAAQAKSLGMSLEQVDKIAGSLLDFESSITNELSAELITGKQINLEQARLYALNNDMAGLSREIAKNFGSVAEYSKMNRIQQEAAAKAVGMSREELATTLTDQAALKGLSGDKLKDAQAALDLARAQGMTEDQIAQQGVDGLMKQQSVQERLNNSVEKMKEVFMGIAEPIMQIISPLMDLVNLILPAINLLLSPLIEGFSYIGKLVGWISTGISSFSDWLKKGSAAATALKIILYPIMGIVAAIAAAMIYSALSAIPVVGPFLAPIAVVGLIGMIAKAASAKPAPMAKGGIIPATPGGTLIQAGEAGKAEAIIPLDNSGGFNIKTSSPPQQQSQPFDYAKLANMINNKPTQPIQTDTTVKLDGDVLTKAVSLNAVKNTVRVS